MTRDAVCLPHRECVLLARTQPGVCLDPQALLWQADLSKQLRSLHRRTGVLLPQTQTSACLHTELHEVSRHPVQVCHGTCALELCCLAYPPAPSQISVICRLLGVHSVIIWVVDEGTA